MYGKMPCFSRGLLGFGSPAPRGLHIEVGSRCRGFLIQKIRRAASQSLRGLPQRQKRNVLLSALHAADMGAVDTHSLGHRFLAEARGKPDTPQIEPEDLANIHPQDGCQSRILLLRIIIRDYSGIAVESKPARRAKLHRW